MTYFRVTQLPQALLRIQPIKHVCIRMSLGDVHTPAVRGSTVLNQLNRHERLSYTVLPTYLDWLRRSTEVPEASKLFW
jgi:hypothetical protein